MTIIRAVKRAGKSGSRHTDHTVDSLRSFISTVRLLQDCGFDFIGVYDNRKLKGVWRQQTWADSSQTWYTMKRPGDSSWRYLQTMLSL